jgi:Oxidoreductase-like protein, N-terminal
MNETTKPAKQKIILPPTLQNRIAAKLLPIENCCGSGCRKCNYGRWLKAEKRTWFMLINESTKRMPPYAWLMLIITAYVIGYFSK